MGRVVLGFFNAPTYLQSVDDIDPVLRGLASQPHQAIDVLVVESLRNFLFGAAGSGGLDLVSLNIQRGRDHGIPSYNDMRDVMGMGQAADFSDIEILPKVVDGGFEADGITFEFKQERVLRLPPEEGDAAHVEGSR